MTKLSLFDELVIEAPQTEGVKYAGSKLKLLPHILELAATVNATSVFDGFAGTTRVSQAFAKAGYVVYCNDIAVWSKVFGNCYLMCKKPAAEYRNLIDHLNNITPRDGWFTEHYGGVQQGLQSDLQDGLKKPWQVHNTRKLDGIREEIERLKLDEVDKSVALTSLILAMDKVDSTMGHFVSYLREWSPRSYGNVKLEIPSLFHSPKDHCVSNSDIFSLSNVVDADLAYYDPPYGSNNEKMPPSRVRYASYYHLWTSICLYDMPIVVGKAKRREDVSDLIGGSVFEDFRKNEHGNYIVIESIRRLLRETRASWIILSYSSGGRATAKELNSAIHECGEVVQCVEVAYRKHVMSGMKWTNEWLNDAASPNREFLFLIKRNS